MNFGQDNSTESIGEKVGYVVAYLLFTTILFLVLNLTHKIPDSWSYFHIMGITFSIVLIGTVIRRVLK